MLSAFIAVGFSDSFSDDLSTGFYNGFSTVFSGDFRALLAEMTGDFESDLFGLTTSSFFDKIGDWFLLDICLLSEGVFTGLFEELAADFFDLPNQDFLPLSCDFSLDTDLGEGSFPLLDSDLGDTTFYSLAIDLDESSFDTGVGDTTF